MQALVLKIPNAVTVLLNMWKCEGKFESYNKLEHEYPLNWITKKLEWTKSMVDFGVCKHSVTV